jgi:hypothetical protein
MSRASIDCTHASESSGSESARALSYNGKFLPTGSLHAEVAELADALASGASGRKAIGVRVPASAPNPHCVRLWHGKRVHRFSTVARCARSSKASPRRLSAVALRARPSKTSPVLSCLAALGTAFLHQVLTAFGFGAGSGSTVSRPSRFALGLRRRVPVCRPSRVALGLRRRVPAVSRPSAAPRP